MVDESYPIVIGHDLVPSVADRLEEPELADLRLAIVTDDTVRPLLAEALRSELARRGRSCAIFSIPPGETSKTVARPISRTR
jgi:3-dehydroquinate synthase